MKRLAVLLVMVAAAASACAAVYESDNIAACAGACKSAGSVMQSWSREKGCVCK